MHLTVCSYNVTYPFHSESTFYISLNVKELLAQRGRDIWSLSNCSSTRNRNHLLHLQTLKHLVQLTKWLSRVASTYLYCPFDCIFLLCHVRVSEWIHTPYLSECQEVLARNRRNIWKSSDFNWTRDQNHLIRKPTLNHMLQLTKWLSWVASTYLPGAFDCMFLSCLVRVLEWIHTLYIRLNVKKLLTKSRRNIWSLNHRNGTRTDSHFVPKPTLNPLAKLTKCLRWFASTSLYSAFDCMFLSCQVRVSKWINNLYLPECQGTPCPKQAQYLKFKWLQRDSNGEPTTIWPNLPNDLAELQVLVCTQQ